MDRMTIVSGDSHVGLPAPQYREYFEPSYRNRLDGYLDDNGIYHAICRKLGYPASADVLDVIDRRSAMLTGGVAGYFNPKRRIQEQDMDGVAAEILHPAGPISLSPFFDNSTSPSSPELRAAGARAYNRFLAEFCSFDPNRLLGVPPVYPWPNMAAATETVYWAKENGMVAISPPRMAGVEGDLPALYDRSWDPLWAALVETGLPAHIHAGWGYPQGAMMDILRNAMARSEAGVGSYDEGVAEFFEDVFEARRPLWQLMLSGVFDRFPDLKVVFAEIRADWIPQTLDYLERQYGSDDGRLSMKPREYWQRNCAVTATFMRRSDIQAKDVIGVESIMFGTDYPHIESTWPNTLDFLRVVLDGVKESDARAILGENAISLYGLDGTSLTEVARRVGPEPEEVFGRHGDVDERLILHWNKVNGFGKPPSYDEGRLAQVADDDLRGMLQSQP